MGDPDQKPETRELPPLVPNEVGRFLSRETVMLALVTAIGYLAAFRFQAAYLGHFGVEDLFVTVDLTSLIVSTSGVISFLFAAWYIIGSLPVGLIKLAAQILFVYPFIFVPLLFLYFSFSFSGYSITSSLFLLYIIVVGCISMIRLRRRLINGTTWSQIVEKSLEDDEYVRSRILNTRMIDSKYGGVVVVALIVFFFTSAIADTAGSRAASRENSFNSVEHEGERFLLVGLFEGSLIGVGVVSELQDDLMVLSGEMRLVDTRSIDALVQLSSAYGRVAEFSHPSATPSQIERVSFDEAWARLLGLLSKVGFGQSGS